MDRELPAAAVHQLAEQNPLGAAEIGELVERSPDGPPGVEHVVHDGDDGAIHALNRDYRGKDKPTDVLAFSQQEGEHGGLHPELLGDIVISVETAARQAKTSLEEELLTLASHGLCHLLGYDHNDDAEEAEMNARAAALLAEAARRGPVRPA